MKVLSRIFGLLAVLLSDVMCAVVAYNYCLLRHGEAFGYSAPASIAFVSAIPYVVGIAACVVLTLVFKKKADKGH